jgi:predicted DNA-binding transcriptional regulator YafY
VGEHELPRNQAERLQFIEDRLFWVARVGSADVRKRFDVSKAQAAQDIARYREAQPIAILYEPKLKTFVPAGEFEPLYARQSLERFLGLAEREDFTEGEVVDFAVLQPPGRKVDLHIAQILVRAILRGEEVEVDYVSISSGLRRRWLAPHAMASDGMRVHIRAYDFGGERFSDFVTGRIQRIHATRPSGIKAYEDAAWFDILNLELVPNPNLARDRREAVRRDYGFEGEVLVVPVRRAMLIYLNTRLLLHSELAGMPHAEVYRQLVPQDQAAFDALLDSVRGEPSTRDMETGSVAAML